MAKDTPIRVIVVDDVPLIRSGLSGFLMVFHELQMVGEAANGQEALELCELVEPDVVLMDLMMPLMDGLTATRTIRQRWPHIKILTLSNTNDPVTLQNIKDAGADGHLTKDLCCASDLAQAIREIYYEGHLTQTGAASPLLQLEFPDEAQPIEASLLGRPDLAQEMAAAVKMQADLLPASAPDLLGWDLAATLEPARETSGDFFDFIPLSNGHWGIVVADVADKGMGAAMFMTLCSTLLRTYVAQYPTLPAIALSTVSDRILADTRGDMFVTLFLGILDPESGRMRYVNAGHNPPFLVSCRKGKPADRLWPTGMALGVLESAHWTQKLAKFSPGDLLVIYTDGITEAQDRQGRYFGEERLLQLARVQQGRPAEKIQESLLAEVRRFRDGMTLQDDIAVMIIQRK